MVGRALVQRERGAGGEPAHRLPRAHDPTHVGEPEEGVALAQVEHERQLGRDLDEETAVDVHRALVPAGRAGRVCYEQRVLAVDLARGALATVWLWTTDVATACLDSYMAQPW